MASDGLEVEPEDKTSQEEQTGFQSMGIMERLAEALSTPSWEGAQKVLQEHPEAVLTARDDDGRSALHLLAKAPFVDDGDELCALIKGLVESRADLHARDLLGETPLSLTVHTLVEGPRHQAGQSVCRALLELRSDPNLADSLNGETPLMEAASCGETALCQLLIAYSADIGQSSYSGITALSLAEASGHESTANVLRNAVSGSGSAEAEIEEKKDDEERRGPLAEAEAEGEDKTGRKGHAAAAAVAAEREGQEGEAGAEEEEKQEKERAKAKHDGGGGGGGGPQPNMSGAQGTIGVLDLRETSEGDDDEAGKKAGEEEEGAKRGNKDHEEDSNEKSDEVGAQENKREPRQDRLRDSNAENVEDADVPAGDLVGEAAGNEKGDKDTAEGEGGFVQYRSLFGTDEDKVGDPPFRQIGLKNHARTGIDDKQNTIRPRFKMSTGLGGRPIGFSVGLGPRPGGPGFRHSPFATSHLPSGGRFSNLSAAGAAHPSAQRSSREDRSAPGTAKAGAEEEAKKKKEEEEEEAEREKRTEEEMEEEKRSAPGKNIGATAEAAEENKENKEATKEGKADGAFNNKGKTQEDRADGGAFKTGSQDKSESNDEETEEEEEAKDGNRGPSKGGPASRGGPGDPRPLPHPINFPKRAHIPMGGSDLGHASFFVASSRIADTFAAMKPGGPATTPITFSKPVYTFGAAAAASAASNTAKPPTEGDGRKPDAEQNAANSEAGGPQGPGTSGPSTSASSKQSYNFASKFSTYSTDSRPPFMTTSSAPPPPPRPGVFGTHNFAGQRTSAFRATKTGFAGGFFNFGPGGPYSGKGGSSGKGRGKAGHSLGKGDLAPHFAALGLPVSASLEQVRKMYRRLVLQFHPDKNKDPEAGAKFLKVQQAYEILCRRLA